MKSNTNFLFMAFVALMLLTACAPVAAPTGATAVTDTPAADSTAATAEVVCEEGFRLFDHELLATDPVCIPENPESFTYLIYPSYIYALGVKPIASWGIERDAENYPMIADWLEGIVDHGMPPNLELLVEMKPDLMLYDMRRVVDIVDELQQIAPLVTFDVNNSYAWQERHRFNAEVFNKADLAEEQIAVYDQRITELRAAIEEKLGDVSDITISLVRVRDEGVINLLGQWYPGVAVIKEVGFDLPDAVDLSIEEMQATHDNIYVAEISEELIPTVGGDVIIFFGSPGGAQTDKSEREWIMNEFLQSELWQTLEAMQNDSFYFKGDNWLQPSILTAHLVIDELAEIFEVEIATPNPFAAQ